MESQQNPIMAFCRHSILTESIYHYQNRYPDSDTQEYGVKPVFFMEEETELIHLTREAENSGFLDAEFSAQY